MKKLWNLKLVMMLLLATAFVACSDDDDAPEELLPKLDGVYVYGTNTIAAEATEPAARMALAQLDPGKAPKVKTLDGLYGKFMYIGANAKIKVAHVAGGEATVYGATNGGVKENGTTIPNGLVPIDDMVIHGPLVAEAEEITVANEGLYYTVVNTNDKTFVIVPVKAQIIGDATPKDWAEGTDLALKSVSKDSAVFESTIKLIGARGYRYRFNKGWHAYDNAGVSTTLSSLGVASYGDSWASGKNPLLFSLENIPNRIGNADMKVKLVYNAATDTWSEFKDLSNVKMSLFGNAFEIDGVEAAWDKPYELKTPTKSGSKFIWKWSGVKLIEGRQFIFLQDGTFGETTWLLDWLIPNKRDGAAINDSKIKNAKDAGQPDANYYVATGGTYDVTVTFDGKEGGTTITIVAK